MKTILIGTLMVLACWFAAQAAYGADLKAPERIAAGDGLTIPTQGSGDATLYLVGPASAVKRTVKLGQEVQIKPEEVRDSGRYTLILNGETATFWVMPNKTARLSFLARPSRLPVAVPNGIGGVVYPFDNFHNLVVAPQPVKFDLSVKDGGTTSRTVQTRNGVAWVNLDSSRKEGSAQFIATVDGVSEKRVVQQVASDPCTLRMKAERTQKGIEVATDPIRDCSGNPVPDGTIVTFTAVAKTGKSSVDARIKRGIAKAELPPLKDATISVASGVVMGNEIRIGGGE